MPTRYTHSEKTARDGLGGDPKSQVGTKFVPDFMYTPGMAVEGAFIDWLASHGAWISPKLAFKDYSEEGAGRGLVALEDFAKDEVLFKVPRKVLLSQKTASQRTDILRNASKAGWSRIMWSIVLERLQGDASFWKPYFDIVPAKFNLPISWTEQDKAHLAGTGVLEMIGEPDDDFKKNFVKVARKFESCKDLSIEQLRELYYYSGSLVSSYSFMEDDGTIVMVSMADMLNHKTGYNNARLFFEKDELQMICVKDVKAGEQLYNTYGDLGNAELLFKYGYMDEANEFSQVEIHVSEFMDFAESHSCPIHNPSQFKVNTFENLLEKGFVPEMASLASKPAVSPDLLKWFQKGYKTASELGSLKPCVTAFLKLHLAEYSNEVPITENQKLAKRLVEEQKSIITAYINFIDSLG